MPPNPGFTGSRPLDPQEASTELDKLLPIHIERQRKRAAELRAEAQSWRSRAGPSGNRDFLLKAQIKDAHADRCELRASTAEESGQIMHGIENGDRDYLDAGGYELIRLARACDRLVEVPVAPWPNPEKAKVTA
jgi:hypothetical protein